MSTIFTRLFEYACPASNVVAAISHKSFVWLHCKSTIIFKICYLVPPALFNQCWQRLTRPTHEEILRKIQINFRDRQQEFLRSCAPSPVFALCRCRLCKTNLISAFEIVITKVAVRMKKKNLLRRARSQQQLICPVTSYVQPVHAAN